GDGVVDEVDAGRRPGESGQSGAIEPIGTGGGEDVRIADVHQRRVDRREAPGNGGPPRPPQGPGGAVRATGAGEGRVRQRIARRSVRRRDGGQSLLRRLDAGVQTSAHLRRGGELIGALLEDGAALLEGVAPRQEGDIGQLGGGGDRIDGGRTNRRRR